MFCYPLASRSSGRTQEFEAPGLRRSHPTLPNTSFSSWVPHSLTPTARGSTHSSPAPLVFTFPASKIFYFRSAKCTSVGANQRHRCWQSILGNVVEPSGRKHVAVAVCDAIVRTEMWWRFPSWVTVGVHCIQHPRKEEKRWSPSSKWWFCLLRHSDLFC